MGSKVFYLIDEDPDEQHVFDLALKEIDRRAVLIWRPGAEDALAELTAGKLTPNYIFIEIDLAPISGWECLKKIRSTEHLQKIPIVMYSTGAKEMSRVSGPEVVLATDIIDKKPSMRELVSVLRGFINIYP